MRNQGTRVMRLGRKGAPETDKPLVWEGKGPLQIEG